MNMEMMPGSVFEFECAENPLNSETDLDENFANSE